MTENKTELEMAQKLGIQQRFGRVTKLRRWLVVAVGVVATGALVGWVGSEDTSAPRYKTQPVERGSLMVSVTATGNLEPIDQVDVGSELSGIIQTVEVDYNDSVRVGQILAKLNTDRLDAQLLESEAVLESAQAKVREAEATSTEKRLFLDRVAALVAKDLSPQSELDAVEAAFKRALAGLAGAKAQVSQAEATLNARRTDRGKAVIRSPITGFVMDRTVEAGQTVAASLQSPVLFTLAQDLTQMELHLAVDEADIGFVREGQQATFTVDAYPGRSFPAEITQLRYGSETVEGVVTYEAVLGVDNNDLALRPGMTATAEIIVKTVEDVLLVPNAALRFEPPTLDEDSSKRSGSLISAILPRRPGGERNKPTATQPAGVQQVWLLSEGRPVALAIETGATDGRQSVVVAGDIELGLAVVVEMESGGRS